DRQDDCQPAGRADVVRERRGPGQYAQLYPADPTSSATAVATNGTLRLSLPCGEMASVSVAAPAPSSAAASARGVPIGGASGHSTEPGNSASARNMARLAAANIA